MNSRVCFITSNKILLALAIGIFSLVATGFCAPYTNFHVRSTSSDVVDLKLLYPYNGETLYTFALLENGDIQISMSEDDGRTWTHPYSMYFNASAFDVSSHNPTDSSYDFDIAWISKSTNQIKVTKYSSTLNSSETGGPLNIWAACSDVSLSWPHLAASHRSGTNNLDVSMWEDSGNGIYLHRKTYGWLSNVRYDLPSVDGSWLCMYWLDPYGTGVIRGYRYWNEEWQDARSVLIGGDLDHVPWQTEIATYQEDTGIAAWQFGDIAGSVNIAQGYWDRIIIGVIPPAPAAFAVTADSERQYLVTLDGSILILRRSRINEQSFSSDETIDTPFDTSPAGPSRVDVIAHHGTGDAIIVASQGDSIECFAPMFVVIEGFVFTESGANISDVELSFSGDGFSASPTTNSLGYYSQFVPYDWSGVVTPNKPGYSFSPETRSYTNVIAATTFGDYTAPDYVCIDLFALLNYIDQWERGDIDMPTLMGYIARWKWGVGCN